MLDDVVQHTHQGQVTVTGSTVPSDADEIQLTVGIQGEGSQANNAG